MCRRRGQLREILLVVAVLGGSVWLGLYMAEIHARNAHLGARPGAPLAVVRHDHSASINSAADSNNNVNNNNNGNSQNGNANNNDNSNSNNNNNNNNDNNNEDRRLRVVGMGSSVSERAAALIKNMPKTTAPTKAPTKAPTQAPVAAAAAGGGGGAAAASGGEGALAGPLVAKLYAQKNCTGEAVTLTAADAQSLKLCEHKFADGRTLSAALGSIRVTGRGELDVGEDCNGGRYWGSVLPLDGCVNVWGWPPIQHVQFASDGYSLDKAQPRPDRAAGDTSPPKKYNVVYSCESSTYFGYQAQANYYAFLNSGQEDAAWTRLMTSSKGDDLVSTFPTFHAKRHLYSRRYGPLNKADILAKWFASVDSPREDVIVVIDPDNFLLKNLRPYVDRVRPGHGLAQRAWFAGHPMIQKLWDMFCLHNCDFQLDHVAVPYFVHRQDLAVIAPLYRDYTLAIKQYMETHKDAMEKTFGGIQIGWGAEMFGYIFAAAHAGVKHTVEPKLQVRDVEGRPTPELQAKIPMIHMGRAWFPKDYEPGQKWEHTEGKAFSGFGRQVWCKCNYTASDIIPWPLPDNIDFQSKATLETLYKAREKFGPIPVNEFRGGSQNAGYYYKAYP